MEDAELLPIWRAQAATGAEERHQSLRPENRGELDDDECVAQCTFCGRTLAGAIFLLVALLGALFVGHRMGRESSDYRELIRLRQRQMDTATSAGAVTTAMAAPCASDSAPLSRVLEEMAVMSDRFVFGGNVEYWDFEAELGVDEHSNLWSDNTQNDAHNDVETTI